MDAQDIGDGMWSWREEDSAVYRALAEVAVPGRESQLATMLCLLPFGRDEAFRIADAGCGEGVFARAALTAYPTASVLGLDGSASMREHAEALLEPFGERAEVMAFELEGVEWLDALDGADCLVSSLALHHLTAEGKRDLFAEAYRRLGRACCNDGGGCCTAAACRGLAAVRGRIRRYLPATVGRADGWRCALRSTG